jgi:hypothetical protein
MRASACRSASKRAMTCLELRRVRAEAAELLELKENK